MTRGKAVKRKDKDSRRRQEFNKEEDEGKIEGTPAQAGPSNIAGPVLPEEYDYKLTTLLKPDDLSLLRKRLSFKELNDVPPLLAAAVVDKCDLVKRLLMEGCHADCRGPDDWTPLMWAVKNISLEMIDLLITYGADVTLVERSHNNAIFLALQDDQWDQETFLSLWNSVKDCEEFDVNHANTAGNTILHYATRRQWDLLIELLLEKKIDLNCKTKRGVTPLTLAGSLNLENMVKILLKAGADITSEDERGCTVLCYALSSMVLKGRKNSTVTHLLQALNAPGNTMRAKQYLQRRLLLLSLAPGGTESYLKIVTNVVTNVIDYFVRFFESGLEILLEQEVFEKITEAVHRHLQDPHYCHALIGVYHALLRYCRCCFGCGQSQVCAEQLNEAFVGSGAADTCRDILQKHCATEDSQPLLVAALLPLISVFGGHYLQYGEPHTWLRNHHNHIRQFQKTFLTLSVIKLNFTADTYHLELVKNKMKAFKRVMLELGDKKTAKVKCPTQKKVKSDVDKNSDCIKSESTNPQNQTFTTTTKKDMRKAAKEMKVKLENIRMQNLKEAKTVFQKTKPIDIPNEVDKGPVGVKNTVQESPVPSEKDGRGDVTDEPIAPIEEVTDKTLIGAAYVENLFQDIVKKYLNVWKWERQHNYPGHQVDRLPTGEDVTLTKLGEILPSLEQEFINLIRNRWQSLTERLKHTDKNTFHKHICHLDILLQYSLTKLSHYKGGEDKEEVDPSREYKMCDSNVRKRSNKAVEQIKYVDYMDYKRVRLTNETHAVGVISNETFDDQLRRFSVDFESSQTSLEDSSDEGRLRRALHQEYNGSPKAIQTIGKHITKLKHSNVGRYKRKTVIQRNLLTPSMNSSSLNNILIPTTTFTYHQSHGNKYQTRRMGMLKQIITRDNAGAKGLRKADYTTRIRVLTRKRKVLNKRYNVKTIITTSNINLTQPDFTPRSPEPSPGCSPLIRQTPFLNIPPLIRQAPPQDFQLRMEKATPQDSSLLVGQAPPLNIPTLIRKAPSPDVQPRIGKTPPPGVQPLIMQTPPPDFQSRIEKAPPLDIPPLIGQTPPPKFEPRIRKPPLQDFPPLIAPAPSLVLPLQRGPAFPLDFRSPSILLTPPPGFAPRSYSSDPSLVYSSCNKVKSAADLVPEVEVHHSDQANPHLLTATGSFCSNHPGSPMSVKCVSLANDTQTKTFLESVSSWLLTLHHENIANYSALHMVDSMLLAANTLYTYNLDQYLTKLRTEKTVRDHAKCLNIQILHGLNYLHTRTYPVMHGNLKPNNILVDRRGVVKLADFGLKMCYSLVCPIPTCPMWWSSETHLQYLQDSAMFCTLESDVQVAGMILYYIETGGIHPFGSDESEIQVNVMRGQLNMEASLVNCELIDLVELMTQREVTNRPTFCQTLDHFYFWDISRKWKFVLTCGRVLPVGKSLGLSNMQNKFQQALDSTWMINEELDSWIPAVRERFLFMEPIETCYPNTLTGLLRFIQACIKRDRTPSPFNFSLNDFFLTTFPTLPLTLHKVLESLGCVKQLSTYHYGVR